MGSKYVAVWIFY